jgi:WD40 repeat protein
MELFSSAAFPNETYSVALSGDGKILAAGGDNGNIKVWDFSAGIPK